jgi:hypothetical protein
LHIAMIARSLAAWRRMPSHLTSTTPATAARSQAARRPSRNVGELEASSRLESKLGDILEPVRRPSTSRHDQGRCYGSAPAFLSVESQYQGTKDERRLVSKLAATANYARGRAPRTDLVYGFESAPRSGAIVIAIAISG